MLKPENPFQLTRAADLTDEQIIELWVDLNTAEGFRGRTRPSSQTAMILMGGKGCGKTHLLRYFSFPLQLLRAKKAGRNVSEIVNEEGYIGVYLRSDGLNSSRFAAKGQDAQLWADVFAYYFEIWLAQLVLQTVSDFVRFSGSSWQAEAAIVENILALFDRTFDNAPSSIEGISRMLAALQRELDYNINNCSKTRKLEPRILVTRGHLIFGLPKILASSHDALKSTVFMVLIDEYENLNEDAQRFINTLVREKQHPTSFKLGAKLFGLRTFKTLSGDEDLKEGSEYEKAIIDADLRGKKGVYSEFAANLVTRRIEEMLFSGADERRVKKELSLDEAFLHSKNIPLEQTELGRITARFSTGSERPWIAQLRSQLEAFAGRDSKLRLAPADIPLAVDELTFGRDLLVEKTNCFLAYRAWFHSKDFLSEAKLIGESGRQYSMNASPDSEHGKVLDKFRSDLIAQMCRATQLPVYYLGFDTFVDMSQGIARNLLIILKQVYDWASFHGEKPFRGTKVSVEAQLAGVSEASEWFYRDAHIIGPRGVTARRGINRLGELFKAIRYSNKPSECSLCTFSVDLLSVSPACRATIDLCEQWSLLVKVGDDRKDRNSDKLLPKYQLNSMLAPRYLLPIASRGNIHLEDHEAEAIFNIEPDDEFDAVLNRRTAFMNAPFTKGLRAAPKPPRSKTGEDEFLLF